MTPFTDVTDEDESKIDDAQQKDKGKRHDIDAYLRHCEFSCSVARSFVRLAGR